MGTGAGARLVICVVIAAALAGCGGGVHGGSAPSPARSPAPVPATSARSPSSAAVPPASPAPATPPAGSASATPGSSTPAPSPGTGVPARLAGKDWEYIPTQRRVVALTFDAGANDAGLASILATLRADGVPATFFLTGDFARDFPASARRIAAAGHRIGDHTISHPHLTQLSNAEVRQQILGAAAQIMAVTGANPAPLFRFPFGESDSRTIAVVNQAGYVPVRWSVDTLGWEGTAGHITVSVVVSRVLNALRPGEIVLMHVGSNPDDHSTLDAGALPRVISELRALGYSFVTLDALTG